jgi:hypothetical protein
MFLVLGWGVLGLMFYVLSSVCTGSYLFAIVLNAISNLAKASGQTYFAPALKSGAINKQLLRILSTVNYLSTLLSTQLTHPINLLNSLNPSTYSTLQLNQLPFSTHPINWLLQPKLPFIKINLEVIANFSTFGVLIK